MGVGLGVGVGVEVGVGRACCLLSSRSSSSLREVPASEQSLPSPNGRQASEGVSHLVGVGDGATLRVRVMARLGLGLGLGFGLGLGLGSA